ncbi:MAG: zf-HC2 domain-containing protein [Gemmatimonadales bacterium]
MTPCEELTERMPAVARGEATWDAGALAHLATCPDCAAEWRVLSATIAVGRSTPDMDAEGVARAVVARLGATRHRYGSTRRWLGGMAVLTAAAAIALMLWPRAPSGEADQDAAPVPVFLPELDSLTTSQLESVLGTLDAPLGSVRTLDAPDLSGLSDDQLSAVLQSMEG